MAVEVRSPTLTLATQGPLFDAHAELLARLDIGFPEKSFPRHVVPARTSKASWDAIATRPPFLAYGWTGLEPERGNGGIYYAKSRYELYIGIKNELPQNMLAGDKQGVGLLGFAGLAIALLHNMPSKVGTWECGPLQNAMPEVWDRANMALLAVEATCRLAVTDERAAGALPEFLRVGADWGDLRDLPETLDTVRPA